MNTRIIGVASVLLAGLTLSGCGSSTAASSGSTQTQNATGPAVEAPVAAPVVSALKVVNNDQLGPIVQDGAGNTLYAFTKDKKDDKSVCNDACATAWPPARVTDVNLKAEGIDASLISTITRDDGTKQLALNKWPLYRFAADGDATGTTKGQGNKGVWFVLNASGALVKTGAATEATTTTAAPSPSPVAGSAPVVPAAGALVTSAIVPQATLVENNSVNVDKKVDQRQKHSRNKKERKSKHGRGRNNENNRRGFFFSDSQ